MKTRSCLNDLADWLYAIDPLSTPAVEKRARLLFLDTLGCFIAAQAKPEPAALANLHSVRDPGPLTLPGCSLPFSTQSVAMLFALGACWDEACEGLARAHGRPGLHAIPAALGAALASGRPIGDLLRAIVTGFEIGGRMGEALRIKGGMHVDGAWGALGAAAAAARAFGASSAECVRAIETVACQVPFSLYAPVSAGATARNTYCGHGAVLGLNAALSAMSGIGSPPDAIDDYFRIALGGDGAPRISPPGDYYLLEGYLKPFAAVRHVHYGAQCAIDWRKAQGGDTHPVSAVHLKVYQEAVQYCGNRNPQSAIQAQFSLSYGLAHALRTGDLGPEAYTAEALGNPETRRIEALVEIEIDAALTARGERGAALSVTRAGAVHRTSVEKVAGDPDLPLDESAVRAKFKRYTAPQIGETHSQALAEAVLSASLDSGCAETLSVTA